MNIKTKELLKDVTACSLTIIVFGGLVYGMIALTEPLGEKLKKQGKKREDYINSGKYSSHDLVVTSNNDVLLGNVPYSKRYHDFEDKEDYIVLRTKNGNLKILDYLFTSDVNPIHYVIPNNELKQYYTEEEVIQLEKNIRVRKLS